MRKCSKCGQDMISAGPVCGRPACSPELLEKYLPAVEHGKNGKREIQLFDDPKGTLRKRVAPTSKAFDFWAVSPSSWPYLLRGVQDIRDIQHNVYKPPVKTREYIGRLSNAGRGGKVNYTLRTSSAREYILRSDEQFTQKTRDEQLREKAAREMNA